LSLILFYVAVVLNSVVEHRIGVCSNIPFSVLRTQDCSKLYETTDPNDCLPVFDELEDEATDHARPFNSKYPADNDTKPKLRVALCDSEIETNSRQVKLSFTDVFCETSARGDKNGTVRR
jgi:hypothetical protein